MEPTAWYPGVARFLVRGTLVPWVFGDPEVVVDVTDRLVGLSAEEIGELDRVRSVLGLGRWWNESPDGAAITRLAHASGRVLVITGVESPSAWLAQWVEGLRAHWEQVGGIAEMLLGQWPKRCPHTLDELVRFSVRIARVNRVAVADCERLTGWVAWLNEHTDAAWTFEAGLHALLGEATGGVLWRRLRAAEALADDWEGTPEELGAVLDEMEGPTPG